MNINRRNFLLSSLAAGSINLSNTHAEGNYSNIVKLGNTDINIPEVGYGSSMTSEESIVAHAYDRGIRYFDTAESYHGGDSEISIFWKLVIGIDNTSTLLFILIDIYK